MELVKKHGFGDNQINDYLDPEPCVTCAEVSAKQEFRRICQMRSAYLLIETVKGGFRMTGCT